MTILAHFPLEVVTERDIDLLILEELIANQEFRVAFVALAVPHLAPGWSFSGAWHSVTHPALGESDLILIVTQPGGERHALLVENKIDAPPQPDQALRYRRRGEEGVTTGDWHTFSTCMTAPRKYLGGTGDARNYDSHVAYEWLHDQLSLPSLEQERMGYRCQMLAQAIDQNRRGYTPKHDERVTAFWRAYWESVQVMFPDLAMAQPISKPAGSDWIEFRGGIVPAGYTILHKLANGAVDLQTPFPSTELSSVTDALALVLHEDMMVEATGKSCSIRLKVPQMDRFKEFASQSEEGHVGMRHVYRLACIATGVKRIRDARLAVEDPPKHFDSTVSA